MNPHFKIRPSESPEVITIIPGMRRLMGPVKRYTRFVVLSRVFLWVLVAAMIAAVIWIASDSNDNGARMVFSNVQKTGNLQNVMLHPYYQGVDAHDRPYTIIADKATQLDKDNVRLEALRADMSLMSGAWVALNAGIGDINLQTKQMLLSGGIDAFYDGGYEFRSDHAQVDIQKGNAYGDAPVEGQGPPGTLKANSFTVLNRGEIIRFNGSVRMILYR